ncbi:MAG: M42 family peptidase, partial [Candidatus Pacebacteria bacterium]|nr:M42 family peptidase [Candidatus Paceibacterota bacterium]
KGPVITIVDAGGRGLIASSAVVKWLRDAAESNNIPHQMDVGDGGTTDATSIHLTREGIPSSVISVPTRYIHSPVEVIDIFDLQASADLIVKAVEIADKHFETTIFV